MEIPAGFRFMPTEEDLLRYYLLRKIKGEGLPEGFVHNCSNVYDQKPWDLWEEYKDPSDSKTKHLYFFTHPPRKTFSWYTIRPIFRTGNWRAEGTRKKVRASGTDTILGWRRRFIYKTWTVEHGCWLMDELVLDNKQGYVLCVLRKINKIVQNLPVEAAGYRLFVNL